MAEGVSFLATANIGNEYRGTRVLDRALSGRFSILEFEYLSQADEMDYILSVYGDAFTDIVNLITQIAADTRKDFYSDKPQLSTCISTRESIEIVEAVIDGFTILEALECTVYPLFSAEGGTSSERTFLKQLVQRWIVTSETNKQPAKQPLWATAM